MQASNHGTRAAKWAASADLIAPAVRDEIEQQYGSVQKYNLVQWVTCSEEELCAHVSKKDGNTVECWIRRTPDGTNIHCPCRYFEDCGILCSRLQYLILRAVTQSPKLAARWDRLSTEFVDKSMSVEALRTMYDPKARFPVVPLATGDPYSELRRLMKHKLEETGAYELPMYPYSVAPRKQSEKKKRKKKIKKGRFKAHGESTKGKKRTENSSLDDSDDVGDAKKRKKVDHKDGEKEISPPWDCGIDFNAVKEAYAAVNGSVLSDEVPTTMGKPEAKIKKRRREYACARCGQRGHTRPTCESTDISFMLRKLRLLPADDLYWNPKSEESNQEESARHGT